MTEHNRSTQTYTVKSVEDRTVHTTDGTAFLPDESLVPYFVPGKEFVMETVQGSKFVGFQFDGVWVWRKTDADIDADHETFVKELNAQRAATLAKNQDEYTEREAALPEWLKPRFAKFHEAPDFARDGWGYELVVGELAAIYSKYTEEEIRADDIPEVSEYAAKEGTSGNQHGFARLLALTQKSDPSILKEPTASALTPLTGQPFFVPVSETGEAN